MFFSKPKQLVGLDVGTSAVKVFQLKESGGGYQLVQSDVCPLDPDVIVDGTVMDAERVISAIQEIFSAKRIKTKNVALSVSGISVIVKKITLPEMTEEELDESIQWEAEQYIPFDIEDVNIDYQILGPVGEEGAHQMEVLLVAVKKDKINEYTSLVEEAGLTPVVVDVDAFALENMYEINYEIDKNEAVALIDIGAGLMNINVILNGMSAFTRDISIGGNQFTEAIQKEFGVSFEDAEKVKKGVDVEGVTFQEVVPILESVSNDVASEILRSFDFFRATASRNKTRISRVMISGGCARMKGLKDFLSKHLGMEVGIMNPFQNIEILEGSFDFDNIQEIAPTAAVGIGLALRRVDD
ncbi:MAG: type IV pilus assembly protein PilM [Deltaproteobacteria bacterium]|nr:type IV pilus assembly protein PilM [Deltaproteobacteria bacterium]